MQIAGSCSWYEFAKEIIKLSNSQCIINPITTESLNQLADRPRYSVLSTLKIKNDFDIDIPYWRDSLEKYILKLNKN